MKLAPVVGAVGVGGLLSAFGYTALRAHWNFLGVMASGSIPAERYIAETWNIVAGAAPLLLLAALMLLVLWGVTAGGRSLLLRYAPRALERLTPLFPLLLLVMLLVAELLVLRMASLPNPACADDVVLGNLAVKEQARCFERRDVTTPFVLVLAVVIAAFIATHAEKLSRLQLIARCVALAVALQLPAVYGCRIKQPFYRVVRATAGGRAVDGLLVLQTGAYVELWDASGGHGRMRFLPANAIVESGPALNLFTVATKVATSRDPNAFQRLCNEHLPPGGR